MACKRCKYSVVETADGFCGNCNRFLEMLIIDHLPVRPGSSEWICLVCGTSGDKICRDCFIKAKRELYRSEDEFGRRTVPCIECGITNPAAWGSRGRCYDCTYKKGTKTPDGSPELGRHQGPGDRLQSPLRHFAERAFKFLCHLDLRYHPVDEQRELLAIVRELKQVLEQKEKP